MDGSQPGGVINAVFRGPSVASNNQAVYFLMKQICRVIMILLAKELELMEVGNV